MAIAMLRLHSVENDRKDDDLNLAFRQPLEAASVAPMKIYKKAGILPKKNAVHSVWYIGTPDSPASLEQALDAFRSFFLSPTRATRELLDLFPPLLMVEPTDLTRSSK